MTEIVITQSDWRKTVDALPGDVIVIRMAENVSTGYGWEIDTGEGSIIALEESNYIESADIAMGREGIRVMRLLALQHGNQEVHLHLRRPWDPPNKSLEQFDITIRVL